MKRGEKDAKPKGKKGAVKAEGEEGEEGEPDGEEPELEAAIPDVVDDDEAPVPEDIDEDDDNLAPPKKGGKATRPQGTEGPARRRPRQGLPHLRRGQDALPADIVCSDQIDDVMSMFGDNDIDIVDEANKVKLPETKPPEPEPCRPSEEEAATTTRPREEEDDAGCGKSNDPVRMYLRKMGSVSLLTREGEVEIAKRIEEGEKEVLAPCSLRPSPSRRSSTWAIA